MRRKKKKNKTSTIIIIFLVILVGLIYAYTISEDKKLNIPLPKEEKQEIKEEEISLDDEKVKEAIDSYKSIDTIDRYDDFNISSLTKYNLIQTAINGLDNKQITWCISSPKQITAEISIEDLNNSLNKFIRDEKITIEDIIDNKGETSLTVGDYGYGSYSISINKDKIHIIGSCDGKGPGIIEDSIQAKEIKAVIKEDELYIYSKVAYGKLNKTANALSYDYYKEKNSKDIIETVALNDDLTWDKYNTYKQIYKKIDEKYYFISSKIE